MIKNNLEMNENKIIALREMWVAKLMMLNEDYVFARDKLLTVQQLYPAIDDIESMLMVCDILLLADSIKLSDSEIDDCLVFELLKHSVTYYDVTIHYQQLLTLLQPIRDEFPGTDLALQFLHNAFSQLSGLEKHSECDLMCSLAGRMYTCEQSNSTEVDSNKSGNFEPFPLHNCDTDEKDCLISYQASHSENNSISYPMVMAMRKSNQEFYNFENNRKLEFIQAGQIWAAKFQANVQRSYRYAQINYNGSYEVSVTWLKPIPSGPSERRRYFAGLPVGCGSFDLNPVTNDLVSPMVLSHQCLPVHAGTEDQFEIYPKKGEIWALYQNWNQDEWASNPQKLRGCKFDLVEMLSDFSKASGADVVCLEKVEGFRSVFQKQTIGQSPIIYHIHSNHLYIFCHNIPAYRLMGGDDDKVVTAVFELDQLALPDEMIHEITPMKYLPSLESSTESKLLKNSWDPNDFAIGQVWAVYCGKDDMPQPYIQIDKVISEKQVCVTFLEPLPVSRLDIEWKKRNLPIACGLFELSKTSVILKISQFSHSVEYERSLTETESHFIIYPKKGEVWAVYEDWNEEWKQNDYKNCQYYIAEILSDLLDENGMRIARLVEVENNLTFFRRQQYDGFDITIAVSQAEMFSFSHQIPAFKVQGTAMYGIPEDSWHLDPNALPLKRVISSRVIK